MLSLVRLHITNWKVQIIRWLEFAILPAEQTQTAKQQQISLPIAAQAAYAIARQTVLRRVGGEAPLVQPREPGVFRARPQIAFRVCVKMHKAVGEDAGRIALVEDREADAIKAHQPVKGCQPKITIPRLHDVSH